MKQLLLVIALVWVSMACSKKESAPVNIDAATLELNYDEQHQFVLTQGSNTLNANDYTWASSNTTIGQVSASGEFTASRIGETTVTATAKNGGGIIESKVTVVPYYSFGTEPSFSLGGSKTVVKSYEKRTLVAETDSTLDYQGENNSINGVRYYFNNAAYSESYLFYMPSVTLLQAQTYYDERYSYLGNIQDQGLTFNVFSITSTVGVGVTDASNQGRVAVYLPLNSGGRIPANYLKAAANRIRSGGIK
ncbi:Ig-like domain-containing protein [Siphonobacter sp. SORGH_AS_0500]|uniref:Ig-like domain-containing protein n=1 Tax=Siphonobacter sp. SORGH_AS_0500 TaxID=1864824 RepID=UPI00285702C8|nr:Ig-like domain-containing protein [Siphonobacter sp. SORGH_AS_0500]MDR6195560.1 hypothetical protein [Siphonobacter sp. SORGH_AS_0500]